MARNRVRMAYIENDNSRKATFRKRKGGIMKKALELSTLCDVPVAVFVQSEYKPVPEVFPASREAMGNVLAKWDMLSLVDKTKRMVNQEKFLQQRIDKATEGIKKVDKENKELAMKEVMFDCLSEKTAPCFLVKDDLPELAGVIDLYIKRLNRRMQILTMNDASSSSSVIPPAVATAVAMPRAEMGFYSTGFNGMIQENMNVMTNVKDFDLNQAQDEYP
ncbi:MADS-box transcription factor family protein [Raphanus sativus]|uniref:Agamous-like MADS-box protein AGL80 n=1 Tax=Raphanus sativus TaxID=3726 RepID=A0A6J0N5Y4_RAPSA|nr:agamous-like MADS-box protein AGL80 [Raphanus sativus]KAJ4900634.1 MADS-box transcription factor family protein [Raphanus sativus]